MLSTAYTNIIQSFARMSLDSKDNQDIRGLATDPHDSKATSIGFDQASPAYMNRKNNVSTSTEGTTSYNSLASSRLGSDDVLMSTSRAVNDAKPLMQSDPALYQRCKKLIKENIEMLKKILLSWDEPRSADTISKMKALLGEAAGDRRQIDKPLKDSYEKILAKLQNLDANSETFLYLDKASNPRAAAYVTGSGTPIKVGNRIYITTHPANKNDGSLAKDILHETAHQALNNPNDPWYVNSDLTRRAPIGKPLPPLTYEAAIRNPDTLAYTAITLVSNKRPLTPPNYGTISDKRNDGADKDWTYYINRPLPSRVVVFLPLHRIDQYGQLQRRPSIHPPEITGFGLTSPNPARKTPDYVEYVYKKTAPQSVHTPP